jgi:hypothetical protein
MCIAQIGFEHLRFLKELKPYRHIFGEEDEVDTNGLLPSFKKNG